MTDQIAKPRGLAAWLTPARVAAVTVIASIPAKLLSERLVDPDVWWHLRTGRYIVETGSIPRADIYSFTAPGRAWTVQEWGSEVVLHWIRDAFGLYGIHVWRALTVMLLYVLVARLLIRRMGSGLGTWILLALTAYAGQLSWTERPNLFSFLLFVIVLDLIERRTRSIWAFVPLAALWANLHGMVIIGIGLVALVAMAEGLKVRLHWEDADPLWAKRLGLVAVAGFFATFLNPYGPGLLRHALDLVGTVSRLITEWASPDFHEVGVLPFLILLLVTIAGLALSRGKTDPTDVALMLAFTTLALSAVRNLTMASIVIGLVAARALPSAIAVALPRRADRPQLGSSSSTLIGGVALVAALSGLAIVAAGGFPSSDDADDIITRAYPVAAIDALNRPGVRVFALDLWGGMVIDRTWPNARVYLDTRIDMYGTRMSQRYISIVAARQTWASDLDRFCTTHVLVRPREPIAQVLSLSGDWLVERGDRRSVTFARRVPASGCQSHPIP